MSTRVIENYPFERRVLGTGDSHSQSARIYESAVKEMKSAKKETINVSGPSYAELLAQLKLVTEQRDTATAENQVLKEDLTKAQETNAQLAEHLVSLKNKYKQMAQDIGAQNTQQTPQDQETNEESQDTEKNGPTDTEILEIVSSIILTPFLDEQKFEEEKLCPSGRK